MRQYIDINRKITTRPLKKKQSELKKIKAVLKDFEAKTKEFELVQNDEELAKIKTRQEDQSVI